MLSNEFIKGFRAAVSSYAMNTPRGAYDARPSFTPRTRASDRLDEEELNKADDNRPFTPRTRASDQFEEELTSESDDNRPLPDELMELIRRQVDPDTYQWLCDALNDTANNQDFDEPAEDEPPPFSGRPTAGGSQDPITSASRAEDWKSPAMDANARRIKSLTPGQLAYSNGTPFTGELDGYRYYQGVRLDSRPHKLSSSSMEDYASRFPGAARIKVL